MTAWIKKNYLLVLLAALFVGGVFVYFQLVYGDWTCAFSRCVRMKP